jgi:sulfonate transport system permease protein
MMKQRTNILLGAMAFLAILIAWWVVSSAELISPFLLPSPKTVMATAAEIFSDGTLYNNTLVSVRRLLIGYALSVGLAVPIAFLFSASRYLRDAFSPVLEFMRQLPPLALMPLLILWLGIGETQKVGIIVLACFFPIFLGVTGGITQCDPRLIEVGQACGLSKVELIWRVVLPASLPSIVIGLRIALGYGWRALVGAELVASSAGLGYMIVDAENLARTDIVLVGIVVIGCLGFTADLVIRRVIAISAPWLAARTELSHA